MLNWLNHGKNRRLISTIIIAIVVLAMIVPLCISVFN